MSNKIKGTIIAIHQPVQVTANFAKQEFLIETEDKYPQHIKLQLSQQKIQELGGQLQLGLVIEAEFNLRGKSFNSEKLGMLDAYSPNVEVWKLQVLGWAQQQPAQQTVQQQPAPFQAPQQQPQQYQQPAPQQYQQPAPQQQRPAYAQPQQQAAAPAQYQQPQQQAPAQYQQQAPQYQQPQQYQQQPGGQFAPQPGDLPF